MAKDPFASLKKSRGNVDKLVSALTKEDSKQDYSDDRQWLCQLDKAGNGYAIIRFLPAPAGEDMPWAKVYSHGFKQSGGWYIENCPTTVQTGDDVCPVCSWNSELWDAPGGDTSPSKKIVRGGPNQPGTKRKLAYYSNILVIKDSANPENEGKVFLFRYGKKLFDKIKSVMQPQFEDEQPINPFDFWTGANFKLKIRKVEGYANYDSAEFEDPSELFGGDDAKLKEIYSKLYSLNDFLAPDKFKSYDELKARLDRVRKTGGTQRAEEVEPEDVVETPNDEKEAPAEKSGPTTEADSLDESDAEEPLDYFERLAEGNE